MGFLGVRCCFGSLWMRTNTSPPGSVLRRSDEPAISIPGGLRSIDLNQLILPHKVEMTALREVRVEWCSTFRGRRGDVESTLDNLPRSAFWLEWLRLLFGRKIWIYKSPRLDHSLFIRRPSAHQCRQRACLVYQVHKLRSDDLQMTSISDSIMEKTE